MSIRSSLLIRTLRQHGRLRLDGVSIEETPEGRYIIRRDDALDYPVAIPLAGVRHFLRGYVRAAIDRTFD